jgi:hypothetical protein
MPGYVHEPVVMTLRRLELLNPRSCIIPSYGEFENSELISRR